MDPNAEPSLLLAKHDLAQREHIHNHNNQHEHQHQIQNRNKKNHNHNHNQHRSLHKRQAQDIDGVETVSVIQTISVVQQIDIDSNGNTVSTLYTPTPEPNQPALTQDSLIASPTGGAVASGIADGAGNSQVPLTGSPNSTPISGQSTATAQTSTPSPAFPSLVAASNSTVPSKSNESSALLEPHLIVI